MKVTSSTLLFIAFIFIIFLPVFFMQGMFMDGLIYSTVARNMAHAYHILHGYVSETYLNPFYEQPPLAMLLESFLIRIFGDVFFMDRLFGYLALALSLFGLYRITKLVQPIIQFQYMPLVFFMMVPVVDWSYKNGMLENWMCAFTTLASAVLLNELISEQKSAFRYLVATVLIIAAFLVKGFTGLFPLVIPFLYHLSIGNGFKQSVVDSFKLILCFLVSFAFVLFAFPPLRDYLHSYYLTQVFSSIEGNREVDGHFFILRRMPQELIPLFLLFYLIYKYTKYRFGLTYKDFDSKNHIFFFLSVALSASLPVMVSPKQSGYYVLCSYPFFALFFSTLLSSRIQLVIKTFLNEYRLKIVRWVSMLAICVSIVLMLVQYKSFYRDKEKIEFVDDVSALVGEHGKLIIHWDLQSDYSLKCYFYKRHYVTTYTPNFEWVHTSYSLSTDVENDKNCVKEFVVEKRKIYLYKN